MTQRDDFVNWQLAHVGWAYDASGPWRCTGARHSFDCSGFQVAALNAVGISYPCVDTDHFAAALNAQPALLMDHDAARATRGAWAIRTKENPMIPGDGHIVCSLGDGRTIEAHDHADGVYIGTFDGPRGFQVYGRPPGLAGFDQPASAPLKVVIPPNRTVPLEDHVGTQTDLSMKLDEHGNGYADMNGLKAVVVHSAFIIGIPDPARLPGYAPIARCALTIGPAGWARVVVEGGPPSGPCTVRTVHD